MPNLSIVTFYHILPPNVGNGVIDLKCCVKVWYIQFDNTTKN